MNTGSQRRWWPQNLAIHPMPARDETDRRPTYAQADPALIDAALRWAQRRPSGNWYVLSASADIRADRPRAATVAGTELVAWRDATGVLRVGPGACPHLGAPLAQARVDDGALICRWHGLRLDATSPTRRWCAYPAHDDGVLAWVRLDALAGESPTDAPILGRRPEDTGIHAVTAVTGVCEPRDIIANRLDPWHGAWFHPYSFSRLRVTGTPPRHGITDDNHRFVVEVTFRVGRRLGVPVVAEFTCPDPRTITMRIVSGEGTGSVVETHATPLGPGRDGRPRTAVVEAVIATSDHPAFRHLRTALPVLRPMMRYAANRLWRDDMAYAQRCYELRARSRQSRGGGP